jgi:hypothetical protein
MPLCSRCGTEFQRVSDRALRCPVYGVGATTTRLVAAKASERPPDRDTLELSSTVRSHVNWLWHETGAVPEEARHTVFAAGGLESDAWEIEPLPVDGVSTEFRVMRANQCAIAHAVVNELVVGCSADRGRSPTSGS